MDDVAVEAGVSHGTVSHALNHPDRVSKNSLRKVQEAVDRLGFVRNESARHLRSGTSSTLGLVLFDTWDPFFTEMTKGFEDVAIANGRNVVVANSALSVNREAANLTSFEQRRLEGILIIPQSSETLPKLEQIRRRGTSCVLLDHPSGGFNLPSVSVDNVEGGAVAGRHLIELGCRRILFVGNATLFTHSKDRLEGLLSITDPAGIDVQIFTVAHLDFDRGHDAGAYIASLAPENRPDAVFCSNDMLALGLMQIFARAGIAMPADVAVIGYDDIGLAGQVATPLSTVRQPAYDIGKSAGEVLLRDIESGRSAETEHIVYTPWLVARESTTGAKRAIDGVGQTADVRAAALTGSSAELSPKQLAPSPPRPAPLGAK
ncbi:LacI family DNA-binding transcriptional regulator [Cryobacterium glaciale]|nr:LacI family DNA-binding transcriptional regulator [Cryobacterium glaciale]